jgi:hypothetical protein
VNSIRIFMFVSPLNPGTLNDRDLESAGDRPSVRPSEP